MTPGDAVDAKDLPAGLGMALGRDEFAVPDGSLIIDCAAATLQQFKDQAERTYLVARLNANDWNIAATAKSIETPRSNLYKKLEAYEISREKDGV